MSPSQGDVGSLARFCRFLALACHIAGLFDQVARCTANSSAGVHPSCAGGEADLGALGPSPHAIPGVRAGALAPDQRDRR